MSFIKLCVYADMFLLNHPATRTYMGKTLQQKHLLESNAKIGFNDHNPEVNCSDVIFLLLTGKIKRISVCSQCGNAYVYSFLYFVFISLSHTFFPLPVFFFPHLSFLSFRFALFLLSPSFLLSLSLFFLFQLVFPVFPGHVFFWLLAFPFP